MTTLTIDRDGRSRGLEPAPCTTPWCTGHDAEAGICTSPQLNLNGHTALLSRTDDTTDTGIYLGLGGNQNIRLTPTDAIAYALLVIKLAQAALDETTPAGAR